MRVSFDRYIKSNNPEEYWHTPNDKMTAMMKGVALEMAPHNIKVNTVAMGAVQTALNEAIWQNPGKLQQVNRHIPMQRMGQAEKIAVVVCNLLAAGSYITGSTITVVGGWLLKNRYQVPKPYKK